LTKGVYGSPERGTVYLNRTQTIDQQEPIMRINTGTRTATHVNFVQGVASEPTVWDEVFTETAEWYIEDIIDAHLAVDGDPAEVFQYDLPGLWITALMYDDEIIKVITVEEDDLSRVHTAIRTGRSLSIRYVKADGEVTRRRTHPQSLRYSKAQDVILRAEDERREGDTRSFRWDRITHTTLHREVRPAAPSKSALWAEFQRTTGARDFAPEVCTDITDVYVTTPGTAAALEAPEAVQDKIAERYALGHSYAFITV
jgi:hypothetical protein